MNSSVSLRSYAARIAVERIGALRADALRPPRDTTSRCGPSACRDPCRSSGRPRLATTARPFASLEQLLHVAERRARHRVAPVEQRVDRRRAALLALAQRSISANRCLSIACTPPLPMSPTRCSVPPLLRHCVAARRAAPVAKNEPSSIAIVDAHEVLHHHAARAEVQVADLAVAHLPFGQSDGEPRGVEQRSRACRSRARPTSACAPSRSRSPRARRGSPSRRAPAKRPDVCSKSTSLLSESSNVYCGATSASEMYAPPHSPSSDAL